MSSPSNIININVSPPQSAAGTVWNIPELRREFFLHGLIPKPKLLDMMMLEKRSLADVAAGLYLEGHTVDLHRYLRERGCDAERIAIYARAVRSITEAVTTANSPSWIKDYPTTLQSFPNLHTARYRREIERNNASHHFDAQFRQTDSGDFAMVEHYFRLRREPGPRGESQEPVRYIHLDVTCWSVPPVEDLGFGNPLLCIRHPAGIRYLRHITVSGTTFNPAGYRYLCDLPFLESIHITRPLGPGNSIIPILTALCSSGGSPAMTKLTCTLDLSGPHHSFPNAEDTDAFQSSLRRILPDLQHIYLYAQYEWNRETGTHTNKADAMARQQNLEGHLAAWLGSDWGLVTPVDWERAGKLGVLEYRRSVRA